MRARLLEEGPEFLRFVMARTKVYHVKETTCGQKHTNCQKLSREAELGKLAGLSEEESSDSNDDSDDVVNENQTQTHSKVKWRKTSFTLGLSGAAYLAILIIDILIVELVLPNEKYVGEYAAILTIVNIIFIAGNQMTRFIKVRIPELLQTKNKLQQQINALNTTLVFITGLITILIISFSYSLLDMFGADYHQAQIALVILSLAYFIRSLALIPTALLAYSDNENIILSTSIFEFIG